MVTDPPRTHGAVLTARFAALWQSVRESCEMTPVMIGVTGCRPGDGATTVAANLAISAARASWGRVALVEANLAAPILARSFGVASSPGLVQALAGPAPLRDCGQDTPIENLTLFVAGRGDSRWQAGRCVPSGDAITNILQQLAHDFAVVVCDLPAASDASDAHHWAARLDGTLLVVESGQKNAALACQVRQRLVRSGARLLGAVLNKCPSPQSALLAPPRLTP
jgi:Mrp family chromosome partitioning ATPase